MSTSVMTWDDRVFSMYRGLRANFEQLQKHISFNNSGQPNSFVNITELLIYNSDLNFNNIDERLFMPIIIQEGIPTVNAIPIWERIEGEPTEAYEVFKHYRMLKMNNKPRTMYNLSLLTNIPVSHLETMRHLFNWNYRVQAFDAYMSAERQLMLEQYRVEVEGKHLKMANKLSETAFRYFEENESMITPKVALQMLDWAVKLERITTGLNPSERGVINGGERIQLNVQNNVTGACDNTTTSVTTSKTEIEKVEEDQDRLATMVNILSEIGVLKSDNNVVDIVDYEEV